MPLVDIPVSTQNLPANASHGGANLLSKRKGAQTNTGRATLFELSSLHWIRECNTLYWESRASRPHIWLVSERVAVD